MNKIKDKLILFGLLGFSLVSINFIEANADAYSIAVTADATDISPSGITAEYTGQKVRGYSLRKGDFVVRYLYDSESGGQEAGRRLDEDEFSINPTELSFTDNVIHISTDPSSSGAVLQTDVDIKATDQQSTPKPESPAESSSGGSSDGTSGNEDGGGNSPSNPEGLNTGDVDIEIPSSQEAAQEATRAATSKTGDAIWGMLLFYGAMFILSVVSTYASIKQLRGSGKS